MESDNRVVSSETAPGKQPAAAVTAEAAAQPQTEPTFTLVADQVQALAEEVGAQLVNYVMQCRKSAAGQWTDPTQMTPTDWAEYFKVSFSAESAPEDGVVLGDFMLKDTARHRMAGYDHVVTASPAEVDMYIHNAFGPDVRHAAEDLEIRDGAVTFVLSSGDPQSVVAPEVPWEEAQTGPDQPLTLPFRLGTPDNMTGPDLTLLLSVSEAPESPYGCYVTRYCVTPPAD